MNRNTLPIASLQPLCLSTRRMFLFSIVRYVRYLLVAGGKVCSGQGEAVRAHTTWVPECEGRLDQILTCRRCFMFWDWLSGGPHKSRGVLRTGGLPLTRHCCRGLLCPRRIEPPLTLSESEAVKPWSTLLYIHVLRGRNYIGDAYLLLVPSHATVWYVLRVLLLFFLRRFFSLTMVVSPRNWPAAIFRF